MIPMLMTIDIRHRRRREQAWRGLHLWLPLFLLWIVLAPLVLLLSPLLLLFVATGRNPFIVVAALFNALAALAGTRVEVMSPRASVFIRVF
jgi:hypothetical protein